MSLLDDSRKMRRLLEKLSQKLTDEEALDAVNFHPHWIGDGRLLTTGERIQYNGQLYTVLQGHMTQESWTPEAAPSLFAKVLVSEDPDVIKEWEQPDSTNPYKKGDRVIYDGHIWQSDIDGNVWKPGEYGWTIAES